jgi:hypothetical protein
MIPVEPMVIPNNVVDLPTDNFKQLQPSRTDRVNDMSEDQRRRQQELQKETNNETAAARDHIVDEKKLHVDDAQKYTSKSAKRKVKQKAKKVQKAAEIEEERARNAIDNRGNVELKDEEREEQFRAQEEVDPPEVQAFKRRVLQQSYTDNLHKQYKTTGSDRIERLRRRAADLDMSSRSKLTIARAEVAGQFQGNNLGHIWTNMAPWRSIMLTCYGKRPHGTDGIHLRTTLEEAENNCHKDDICEIPSIEHITLKDAELQVRADRYIQLTRVENNSILPEVLEVRERNREVFTFILAVQQTRR